MAGEFPNRERIEAYARFLRLQAPTGCRWLGTGECSELAAIIEAYLKLQSETV